MENLLIKAVSRNTYGVKHSAPFQDILYSKFCSKILSEDIKTFYQRPILSRFIYENAVPCAYLVTVILRGCSGTGYGEILSYMGSPTRVLQILGTASGGRDFSSRGHP